MKNVYKISFQIYRVILISMLPLFLFAKFMVAMAGHNPDTKISDYVLIGLAVLTAILLTVFNKTYQSKSILRNTLRATIISFVLVNTIFLLYGLYNFAMLYFDHDFTLEDNIPVVILLLLIALSVTLLIGMIKNRI